MSVASTSRTVSVAFLKKQLPRLSRASRGFSPNLSSDKRAPLTSSLAISLAADKFPFNVLPGRRFSGTARFSTYPLAQAQSNAQNLAEAKKVDETPVQTPQEHESDFDPDEPPKKAGFRERLRFLSRRYGWWALAVYLLASLVDFSLVFGAIHLLGADHIRDLEDRFRRYIGVGKRELGDNETAAWPVPVGVGLSNDVGDKMNVNNAEAARLAAKRLERQEDVPVRSGKPASSSSGSGSLWTEAVLAYTIHKTLLLPFRVGVTAAITPSFVKYMVKLGWAKDNAAVQRAAHKVKMAREAAKAKTTSTTNQAKTAVTSATSKSGSTSP
ncbi:hypothetical protein CBS101457_004274 [Exobasidium rhododendri]|nr:hypothetical protein CBS101457_004274 [Exobasidium rhododendri]